MRAIDTFNRHKEQPGSDGRPFRVFVSDMLDSTGTEFTPEHPEISLYHSVNSNTSSSASFGGFSRTSSFSSPSGSGYLSSSPPPSGFASLSSSPPGASHIPSNPPFISVSPPPSQGLPEIENGKPETQEPSSPFRDTESSSELAAVVREVASNQQHSLASRRQLVQLIDSWFQFAQQTGTKTTESTAALHADVGSLRSEVAEIRTRCAPPSKDELASSVLGLCREALDERMASVQALHDAQLRSAEERAIKAEDRARAQLLDFQNLITGQIRELTELRAEETRKNFEELRSCQALLGVEQKTSERLQHELTSLQQSVVTLQAELLASRSTIDGLSRDIEQLRLQPHPPRDVSPPPPSPSIEKIGELDSRLRGLEIDTRQNSAAFTQQLLNRIRELEDALQSRLTPQPDSASSFTAQPQILLPAPVIEAHPPVPIVEPLQQVERPISPQPTPAIALPTPPQPTPTPPQPQPIPTPQSPQPAPTPQPSSTPQPTPPQPSSTPQPTPTPQPPAITPNFPEQMELLFSMGFEDEAANLRALIQTNGDIQEASILLLNSE